MYLDLFGVNSNKNKREPVAKSQKNEVLLRQHNKCAMCKKELNSVSTHFDHIKEVYKGGPSTIKNLQALCANCHSLKTHKDKLKATEKKKANNRNGNDSIFGGTSKSLFSTSKKMSKKLNKVLWSSPAKKSNKKEKSPFKGLF